ncbi:CAMK family protein kinase [Histomonas meleagridis]|uniref:CAMK family protein kinase n=1 Tax=Histomonas meleagridis TaxID=135588 RepID=UPI003559AA81|nr:CAMK family protein kinase [Histomonas meleagridis]KAH0803664.1 CAMK family protein kinase [Histomonas meleagridis]
MGNNLDDLANCMPFELRGYLFQRLIGVGSSSHVFEVYSIKYKQKFSAKVMKLEDCCLDEEGNLLEPEIHALMNLDSPNIIRIYEFFVYSNFLFLILEYCPKGTILDEVNQLKAIPPRKNRSYVIPICQAIQYCHSKGIAHRDIKPSNIFIDSYGRPKIADFGLCALLLPKQQLHTICGSIPYVAPEVLSGEAHDPFKADIFALGVTLYQMATGELPYDNYYQNYRGFPLYVSTNYVDFVSKMISIDPTKRPSMQEILEYPYFKEGNTSTKIIRRKFSAISPSNPSLSFNRVIDRSKLSNPLFMDKSMHHHNSSLKHIFKSQSYTFKNDEHNASS